MRVFSSPFRPPRAAPVCCPAQFSQRQNVVSSHGKLPLSRTLSPTHCPRRKKVMKLGTTLIQSFIQSRLATRSTLQRFRSYSSSFPWRCRFPFRSPFLMSDTYLRLLPSVRPTDRSRSAAAEIRSQGEKRTNDITRKAGRERGVERGGQGRGRPCQRLH